MQIQSENKDYLDIEDFILPCHQTGSQAQYPTEEFDSMPAEQSSFEADLHTNYRELPSWSSRERDSREIQFQQKENSHNRNNTPSFEVEPQPEMMFEEFIIDIQNREEPAENNSDSEEERQNSNRSRATRIIETRKFGRSRSRSARRTSKRFGRPQGRSFKENYGTIDSDSDDSLMVLNEEYECWSPTTDKGSVFRTHVLYHQETRKDKVDRFLQKRKSRCYTKRVSYKCRKEIAQQRQRIHGKFAPTNILLCSSSGSTTDQLIGNSLTAHVSKETQELERPTH